MSINYEVHPDLNLIEVRPVGVVDLSDIIAYRQEALSLGIVTEGTIEYIDFSKKANFHLSYRSAQEIAESWREWLAHGWLGSVFYTPQAFQFGMIRMLGVIVENIEGAPPGIMIPLHEPVALSDVRALIVGRTT